jgi:hypothetical protein
LWESGKQFHRFPRRPSAIFSPTQTQTNLTNQTVAEAQSAVADEVEGPVLSEVKETAVFSRDDKVVILSKDFREAGYSPTCAGVNERIGLESSVENTWPRRSYPESTMHFGLSAKFFGALSAK